jgi:hypothetical protein
MSRKFADFMVERRSRRGFLAWCGKVALALGAAMTGVSLTGLTARAANCCVGTPCQGCPTPPAICPPGYRPVGTSYCCDGDTFLCHFCQQCRSETAYPPDCVCESSADVPCGTPPGLC